MMRSSRRRANYSGLLGREHGGRNARGKKGKRRISADSVLRGAIFLALVGLLTLFYPATRQSYEYSAFREGTIAPEEVIAPETFKVRKNKEEYDRDIGAVREETLSVLYYDSLIPTEKEQSLNLLFVDLVHLSSSAVPDSVLHRLEQIHPEIGPISESSLRFLFTQAANYSDGLQNLKNAARNLLRTIYDAGVIEDKSRISGEGVSEATVIWSSSEERVPLSQIRDMETSILGLREDIAAQLPQATEAEIKTLYELVIAYLTPNLTYNAFETVRRRDDAVRSVSEYKATVLKGERIVDKHDRISAEHRDQLNSLAFYMNKRHERDPYLEYLQVIAGAILSGLLAAIFFVFLKINRPTLYASSSNILLFGILILMPAFVASYAASVDAITPFLVPVALSVMLATVLFDVEIGLVLALVCAALCGGILGSLQHSLVFLITGVTGAYSVRQVHHRSDFYRSILYLILAYTLTISATGIVFYSYTDLSAFIDRIKWNLVFGIFTACASSVLTIGLLPIFESIFNVVTTITLLELSDLNRPLLRNLAIRAPGTYSHSIIMASLSEAAAEAIGADRLLVRVGCYYHDIGKMIRPHYFIENQKGVNPHDELQPRMSALILISHVKEGVELAEEEGLPRAIINIIPQHHGTSEIASFKHRALERGDKQAVRDEDFRYPGPRPQTKEAGIINVADAVESATRTLSGNNPDQIKGMVTTIVKGRFTAGELDECDLTLRDLTRIQEAFLPILQAARHSRVAYPWQQEQQRDRQKEGRESV
jgi:putative nucleotidyltransferase with HDIG domain